MRCKYCGQELTIVFAQGGPSVFTYFSAPDGGSYCYSAPTVNQPIKGYYKNGRFHEVDETHQVREIMEKYESEA